MVKTRSTKKKRKHGLNSFNTRDAYYYLLLLLLYVMFDQFVCDLLGFCAPGFPDKSDKNMRFILLTAPSMCCRVTFTVNVGSCIYYNHLRLC